MKTTLAVLFLLLSTTAFGQVVTTRHGGTGLRATTRAGLQDSLNISHIVRLSADTAITGQTLTGTPLQYLLDSNSTWEFELLAYDSSSSAAGIKFGVSVPSGATIVAAGGGQTTGATAWSSDIITASGTAGVATATAGGYAFYQTQGTIVVGATAGSAMIQFLKVTSGTAIIKAGSYLLLTRIK